ncbi:acetyltransferase [Arcobacter suis CECT 7833]|uniref:Acetyltransferase n=2 Tax=Arcobacter suis TaxID=1278212 RepID=A0AAD0WQS6_9BACT|nr:acetyltransferase [Arcobacter suis CECT 7833]
MIFINKMVKKMQYKLAQIEDIEKVLELHFKYQIDTIRQEDKKDGFITTAFTKEQMVDLTTLEQGLFIAVLNEKVVAYVMSASWNFWSRWPMFAFMVEDLHNLEYLGQKLSVQNSYQYGPVCVDKEYRGSGVLEKIFDFARENMAKRFPILVTFINKINPRSYEAHTKKLKLEVIKEFSYNNNNYYELVYDTSKSLFK